MSVILRDGRAAEVARTHRYTEAEVARTRALHALTMKRQGMPVHLIACYFNVARSTIYAWINDVPPDAAAMVAN